MKPASRKTTMQSIEAELSNLASRRQTLEARKVDALAKLDAAKSARRNVLAGDPTADLSRLNGDVRDVEDDIETLDSVLSDLTAQTEDAEARLAEANDKGERAVAAKALQDIASTFDAGAAELEKAMGDVSKALAKMGAALPETLKVVDLPSDQSKRSDRDRILSIVLADAIASAIPFAMPHQSWRHGYGHGAGLERLFNLADRVTEYSRDGDDNPLDAAAAARALVTDRLRGRADAILAGTASADLADRTVEPPVAPKPVYQRVSVFVVSSFRYINSASGSEAIVTARQTSALHEPVADAAVAAGLALRMDTAEGQAAYDEEKVRRERMRLGGMHPVPNDNINDYPSLGDVMGLMSDDQLAAA